MSAGQLGVMISDDATKRAWEEAEEAVADELGVGVNELAGWEVARELAEAYTGGDALGGWRD